MIKTYLNNIKYINKKYKNDPSINIILNGCFSIRNIILSMLKQCKSIIFY
jgi:hypothetical protein